MTLVEARSVAKPPLQSVALGTLHLGFIYFFQGRRVKGTCHPLGFLPGFHHF
jgi:hypothetical protein